MYHSLSSEPAKFLQLSFSIVKLGLESLGMAECILNWGAGAYKRVPVGGLALLKIAPLVLPFLIAFWGYAHSKRTGILAV